MKIGITGSRLTPSKEQSAALYGLMKQMQGLSAEVHHGCCLGADATAHDLAVQFGLEIVAHPPDDHKHVYGMALTVPRSMPEKPYLLRNRAIVDACDRLYAVPSGPERLRSGTWATVRYARKLRKPITILWANGEVTEE